MAAGKLYPDAWRMVDQFRAERGKSVPDWPDWCFMPLAASYAIVSADAGVDRLPPHLAGDVGRLGALATWRVTQGIYRFDPTLFEAITATPVAGDLPCDVVHYLPEWCVYMETPGLIWMEQPLHGVFAHLEYDVNHGRQELRLLMDGDTNLTPIPLHLGTWPLSEAIARALDTASIHAIAAGVGALPAGIGAVQRVIVEPIISLLLYLCSVNAEIGDGAHRPVNPTPKRTKSGWRLFPADKPTTWDVGVRLGSALRLATAASGEGRGGTHAGPRPHIRRAHWHSFWVGSKSDPEQRELKLKWLPPIPINIDYGDIVPTIRPIGDSS